MLYQDRLFLNSKWRTLAAKVSEKMPFERCQTLLPFGFEVTNDPGYLEKNLNRFYIYFGAPGVDPSISSEETFSQLLLEELKQEDDAFFQRISIVVLQEDGRKTTLLKDVTDNSILFNIEQRAINTTLLEDYATYLSCCLFELEDKTLPELLKFECNQNVRNRFYQLYLIIEYATTYINLTFTDEELRIFHQLHRLDKSPIHQYQTGKVVSPATSEDLYVKEVILNRLHNIYKDITQQNNGYRDVSLKAFNNEKIIKQRLPADYHKNFIAYISDTYEAYIETY